MSKEFFIFLNPTRVTEVVDIGANPIDDLPPYYKMLKEEKLCNLTGFEPQQEALNKLIRNSSPNERYLPYAIGNGLNQVFHICEAKGMSSLLRPNIHILEHFGLFTEFGKITNEIELSTKTLDSISEINFVDFLKIDIQGGELDVFKFGRKKINEAVCIQTEVSFIQLYENQPSFSDIDYELRNQGFIPHCFASVKNWTITPLIVNNDPRVPLNQLLEADLVYVKDFTKPDKLSDEQLKHLALIAHICYKSFDLSMRCVYILEKRGALMKGATNNYTRFIN